MIEVGGKTGHILDRTAAYGVAPTPEPETEGITFNDGTTPVTFNDGTTAVTFNSGGATP